MFRRSAVLLFILFSVWAVRSACAAGSGQLPANLLCELYGRCDPAEIAKVRALVEKHNFWGVELPMAKNEKIDSVGIDGIFRDGESIIVLYSVSPREEATKLRYRKWIFYSVFDKSIRQQFVLDKTGKSQQQIEREGGELDQQLRQVKAAMVKIPFPIASPGQKPIRISDRSSGCHSPFTFFLSVQQYPNAKNVRWRAVVEQVDPPFQTISGGRCEFPAGLPITVFAKTLGLLSIRTLGDDTFLSYDASAPYLLRLTYDLRSPFVEATPNLVFLDDHEFDTPPKNVTVKGRAQLSANPLQEDNLATWDKLKDQFRRKQGAKGNGSN